MEIYVSILDFSCSQVCIRRLSEIESAQYFHLDRNGELLMEYLGYKLANIAYMITEGAPEFITNVPF